jgi:hypothetical protein
MAIACFPVGSVGYAGAFFPRDRPTRCVVEQPQTGQNAAKLLTEATMRGESPTALVGALDVEELRSALTDVLSVVGDFVRHVAEHNLVSERAVLRSMGVEPDTISD